MWGGIRVPIRCSVPLTCCTHGGGWGAGREVQPFALKTTDCHPATHLFTPDRWATLDALSPAACLAKCAGLVGVHGAAGEPGCRV
jgi:hypothetical protein